MEENTEQGIPFKREKEQDTTKKDEQIENDKENQTTKKNQESIENEHYNYENQIKTLPQNKLIQFIKKSFSHRLETYGKQIEGIENSYKNLDDGIHCLLHDNIGVYFNYASDFLIFFNMEKINLKIIKWYKKPSNDVKDLISKIIKTFNIKDFENISERPKKYKKELLKHFEERLNNALKDYRKNPKTKSLSGPSVNYERNIVSDICREEILRKILRFSLEINYISEYKCDLKLNQKIEEIKSKINNLLKNNELCLKDRINIIEQLDDNINALITDMDNLEKSFRDCHFEWYGYYYKGEPFDDLSGLKAHIMNFMYHEDMREEVFNLGYTKTINYYL